MGISKSQGNKEENHEIRGICFFLLERNGEAKEGTDKWAGGGGEEGMEMV